MNRLLYLNEGHTWKNKFLYLFIDSSIVNGIDNVKILLSFMFMYYLEFEVETTLLRRNYADVYKQ